LSAEFNFRHIDTMPAVSVQITRYVDDHFPGFVEFVLIDALGTTHTFVEKVPVVSIDNLSSTSTYPCNVEIQCEIYREWQDDAGLSFAAICTEKPWGIESANGETRFTVFSSQLSDRGPCT
jgi:hypothetical protein